MQGRLADRLRAKGKRRTRDPRSEDSRVRSEIAMGMASPNRHKLRLVKAAIHDGTRRRPNVPVLGVSVALGDGSTAKFWTDAWLSAGAISSFAPNLLRAVGRRHRNRTGKDALHLRIRPSLGTHRRRPAAATGVRPLHLEMDAERRILRFLGLSVILHGHGHVHDAWRQGIVESCSATAGKVLLLARSSRTPLDSRTAWSAGQCSIHLV